MIPARRLPDSDARVLVEDWTGVPFWRLVGFVFKVSAALAVSAALVGAAAWVLLVVAALGAGLLEWFS